MHGMLGGEYDGPVTIHGDRRPLELARRRL